MIANPEVLEGVEGYMGIPAVRDSEGTIWLVPGRGPHYEGTLLMLADKLGMEREEAMEAIISKKVIDLGTAGYLHVATQKFETKCCG